MDEAAEMCERVAIINRGKIVALDSPDNLSITAGRVYLIDVKFDKSVGTEALTNLPGVNRLETAQAIEAADRLRAQQAMAGPGKAGGMGGGQGSTQGQMAGGTPAGMGAGMGKGQGTGRGMGMGTGKRPGAEPDDEKRSDYRFRFYTDNTTLLVSSLVDFSRGNSLQMNILNIRPPSLEDAFVRLTEEKSHAN
jgi:ABC-2 type transport system ATP-binding protein